MMKYGIPACRLPAAGRAGRQKGRFFCLQYQIIRLLDPAVRGFFSSEEKNKDLIGQGDTLINTVTDFTHTDP